MEKRTRIESIDALRAFALLGILMVHISQLYNFNNEYNDFSYFSAFGLKLQDMINQWCNGRFIIMFSILFGTSFYLILRNPAYSRKKFCWRCIILMCFGLFNKLFYTTDILLWYGINGIVLSLFPVRKIPAWGILGIAIALYLFSFRMPIDINALVAPANDYTMRYLVSEGLTGVLQYPYMEVLREDVSLFWGAGTVTLSYFFFGFFLGKSGFIEKFDQLISWKTIPVAGVIALGMGMIYRNTGYLPSVCKVYYFATSILYALIFLYIYHCQREKLDILKYFGRLGLTNYSVQNMFFPIIIPSILIPLRLSFEYIFCFALLFYTFQLYYSRAWLMSYKFGPLEYLWRIMTNRKYVSNKR